MIYSHCSILQCILYTVQILHNRVTNTRKTISSLYSVSHSLVKFSVNVRRTLRILAAWPAIAAGQFIGSDRIKIIQPARLTLAHMPVIWQIGDKREKTLLMRAGCLEKKAQKRRKCPVNTGTARNKRFAGSPAGHDRPWRKITAVQLRFPWGGSSWRGCEFWIMNYVITVGDLW